MGERVVGRLESINQVLVESGPVPTSRSNPGSSVHPVVKQELTTDFLQRGLAPSDTIAQSHRRACV